MFAGTTARRWLTALAVTGFVGLVAGLPIAVNLPLTSDALQGALLYAGGRDAIMVTTPVRLSHAPSVVLEAGLVYDPESVTTRARDQVIGRIALDGAVFRITTASASPAPEPLEEALPLILSQLSTLTFDKLQLRRGTLVIASGEGNSEVLSNITAEVTSNRRGGYAAKGNATYRGATVSLDASWSSLVNGKPTTNVPVKLSLKSSILDASIDGTLGIADDLRLQGAVEMSAPKPRQIARWFGIAVPSGLDMKSGSLKGMLDWSGGALVFSRATVAIDGNEGAGALALSTSGLRPSIDGTLAFQSLNLSHYSFLTPTLASLWPLGFGPGEDESATSVLTRFDADLRVSAAKVTLLPYLQTGRAAAAIAVKDGKLLADIAELEVEGGSFGGQITADMSGPVPRYTLSGKLENVDAGRSLSGMLHRNPLQGRANITLSLTGTGHDTGDLLNTLSGKVGLTLSESGRLGLDLRALLYAAQRANVKGWAAAGKGQTALESLDARLQIENGVILSEQLHAKSASLSIAGSGRLSLVSKALDAALLLTNASGEKASGDTLLFTGSCLEPTIRVEQVPRRTANPQ